MSASCLYSPTIGAGQTERRMKASRFFSYKHVGPEVNAFPRPESLTPSPRPPTPQSPKVQESHHSTWPPRRLFICIRASQAYLLRPHKKPSGGAEQRQGRMWKEARGEQKELRTTGHTATCAHPQTDSCLRCRELQGPLSAERMHSRDVGRKTAF